jgi:hypothetical protein
MNLSSVVQEYHRGIEKVKRKFQTLYGRFRSMLNDAGIKEEMRRGIWAESASTATFYANILVNRETGKLSHESIFGDEFNKLNNLKRFGEMVVVVTKKRPKENSEIEVHTVCMIGLTEESFGRYLPPF